MNRRDGNLFRAKHTLARTGMNWEQAVASMMVGMWVMRPADDYPIYADRKYDGLVFTIDDEIPEMKLADYLAIDWEAWK